MFKFARFFRAIYIWTTSVLFFGPKFLVVIFRYAIKNIIIGILGLGKYY
jgi:hypothetical protein